MAKKMKLNESKRRLITKVAYMYYVEGLTQTDISKKLQIYRTTVGRMLAKARKYGIVKISIQGYDTTIFKIEEQLKQKYDLKDAVVIPNKIGQSNDEKDKNLGKAGFQYLSQIIKPGQTIGVSWGKVLRSMADQAKGSSSLDTIFVPLVGGPSAANTEYHVNGIVYDMAKKFGGRNIFIDSAAVQETQYIRDSIMSSNYFRDIETYWDNLDIALVGIGGPLNGNISRWRDLLTLEDIDLLKDEHAIGDCCCTFYSREGKILKGELANRTIAIGLDRLKSVKTTVGIARSFSKVNSIDVLYKMHILNTLITDEETAQRLLEL